MAYDSARGRVVLFGGGSDNGEGDTWEWDGTNWVQQLPVTSAPARRLHAMSYDGARERVLLFGGLIPTGIGIATDTWEYPGCAIAFTDRSVYGRLLFPPRCAATPAAPPPSVYDGLAVGIYEGANDRFFLSSSGGALTGQTVGVAFSPLVVDDEVHVNGVNSGLGPYTPAPGVPPFQINAPMDSNWIPLPAQEVTIPPGRSDVHFELLDTAGTIYGNTAVYLVRDCGLSVAGNGPMSLNWITHDDEVAGTHPTFEVRYGLLSELRADRNYSRASCLGHFTSTPAVDANPLPAVGEGYYYLVRGLSSCVAQGYGDSLGLVPDPRDALDVLPQCP